MALTDKLKGFIRKRALRDLQEPGARARMIAEAIEESRRLTEQEGANAETAREPLLHIIEGLREYNLDVKELLRAVAREFPEDEFWHQQFFNALMAMDFAEAGDIPCLEREAARQGRNLSLWRRCLDERRHQDDTEATARAMERLVIHFSQYFAGNEASTWYDVDTEGEARSLFYNHMDTCLDGVLKSDRADGKAEQILRVALTHFPDCKPILIRLARLIREQGRTDAESLGVVLRALVLSPGDVDLKIYAGELLAGRKGHEREGIAMLMQAYASRPQDTDLLGKLARRLSHQDHLEEDEAGALTKWFRHNREDAIAAEALAEYFAAREDLGNDAMLAYKTAVLTSVHRNRYMRLIGKAHASQSNWTGVIEVFDGIHDEGDESEDIVIPLATALAEMGRNDQKAIGTYQLAVKLGSRNPEIHRLLCRHMYQTCPEAPDSIRQFEESLEVAPDCSWAELGRLNGIIKAGDFARGMDEALRLLEVRPDDLELRRMAAEALTGNFRRQQMRRVLELAPKVALHILEKASEMLPDALILLTTLARYRLSSGLRDVKTVKLLGEVCRRDAEEVELRIARADLLFELGDQATAILLYRELIERWRAMGGSFTKSGISVSVKERSRILDRVARLLIQPPGPREEDMEIVLEAALDPQADPEFILAVARGLIATGHAHPMRLAFLERALTVAPGDEELEQGVVEARAAKGNPRPALLLGLKRMTARDFRPATLALLSNVLVFTRKEHLTAEVMRSIDQIIAQNPRLPGPPSAVLARAIALAEVFEPKYSGLFEKAMNEAPADAKIAGALARCLEAGGEDSRASDVYRRIVELSPDDNETVLKLARSHARLQRMDPEACKLAVRAYQLAPDDPELTVHYAGVLLQSGEIDRARRMFERMLGTDEQINSRVVSLVEQCSRVDSSQGEMLLLLARFHTQLGRTERALITLGRLHSNYARHLGDLKECYDGVIRVAPDNARAWVERGILWKLSGDFENAEHDLEQAAKLAPGNPSILSEYVEVLEQRLSAQDKPDSNQLVKLATFQLELEHLDAAHSTIGRALRAAPGHQAALLMHARLCLSENNVDEADAALKKLEPSPERSELILRLAMRLEELSEYRWAVSALESALSQAADSASIRGRIRQLRRAEARGHAQTPELREVMAALPDRVRNHYDVREKIADGALGAVYQAYDPGLDELVALRVFHSTVCEDPELVARYRTDMAPARALTHPNVARVHDLAGDGEHLFVVREFLAGGDLDGFFQRENRKLSAEETVEIIRQAARALVLAHQAGIIHADVRPSNILLSSRGRINLADFGLGRLKIALSTRQFSAPDATVCATMYYTSPEVFDGANPTEASDLYSLGVVLYELLAGHPPFHEGSMPYHHRSTAPSPLPRNTDGTLARVTMQCLEKKPAERYASVIQLLEDLDSFDNQRQDRKTGQSALRERVARAIEEH
ncbi:tetratricopeptide repeat protein [Candidatus Poribacteria bacterium]|nr:tetratricopeptide repeat protein [Candidatus Poribacteria bacterium]